MIKIIENKNSVNLVRYMILPILLAVILVFALFGCNSSRFDYENHAQLAMNWIHGTFDNDINDLQIFSMSLVDDYNYVYYSFEFEATIATENGNITSQGEMLYVVYKENDKVTYKFNLVYADLPRYSNIYNDYTVAKENKDLYHYDYTETEILDMFLKS